MECLICSKELTSWREKKLCSECYNKKWSIKCVNCGKEYFVTAHYYAQLNHDYHNCKQCKLNGEGNPNYGKKWSDTEKETQSKLIKSKINEEYLIKCSKGMKGKIVSEETKLKRRNTLLLMYGRLSNFTGHSETSKSLISIKSKAKFNPEYNKRIRKINEERGVWVPIENKNDYIFYKELSNWDGQVINENTIGVELLTTNKLYDKNNRNKNSLVRDHMHGRKSGFENKVFPEIIKHPANCQLITHSQNIKKSKSNNDCVITLEELFDRIISWENYEDQKKCIYLIELYKQGKRYNKEDYINKFYN